MGTIRTIALCLALLPGLAFAQVKQNGPVTPGHSVMWTSNGTIQDGGAATAGLLTELGVTKPGGCAIGINSGPLSAAFEQMCMGVDNTHAYISVQNYGGAPAVPFDFIINGVQFPVPSSGYATLGANTFTGTQTAPQFISTATTGTPPFAAASTTVVPNLNTSFLNGTSWAAPGPIGQTTPGIATFANPLIVQSAGGIVNFVITRPNGFQGSLFYQTSGTNRWGLDLENVPETGGNTGGIIDLSAFSDGGGFLGAVLKAQRGSGPLNNGFPFFNGFAAIEFTNSRATTPGGVAGNEYLWNDIQPTSTLTNPITTTNGSPNVVIAWTAHGLNTNSLVVISGASAVGGITLSGQYKVSATSTNSITVNAGSNATSSAGPGGGTVSITPMFAEQASRQNFKVTNNAPGASLGWTNLFAVQPAFYTATTSPNPPPYYQARWTVANSPNDTSGLNQWAITGEEMDVVNRGGDKGYAPNIYIGQNQTEGYLIVPESQQFGATDGGQGYNATVALFCGRSSTANSVNHFIAHWYDCLTNGPNSLVGVLEDPVTNHGGVGADIYGSFSAVALNGFATSSGLSTVVVTLNSGDTGGLLGSVNGDSVYIPSTYTINNVTFGAASYVMSSVTANGFTITGSGTANATGAGGGTGQTVFLTNNVPYSPLQFQGEFAHGIAASISRFDDGFALYMGGGTGPYGSGLGWTDGASLKSDGSGNLVSAGLVNAPSLQAATQYHGSGGTAIPACTSGLTGTFATVSDGKASPTAGSAYAAADGAAKQPVWCGGSSWVYVL